MDISDTLGLLAIPFVLVIALIVLTISIVVWCRIVGRTGLSGWLGLLMFLPVANLVMFMVLAFGRWPIEDEVRRLRAQVANS